MRTPPSTPPATSSSRCRRAPDRLRAPWYGSRPPSLRAQRSNPGVARRVCVTRLLDCFVAALLAMTLLPPPLNQPDPLADVGQRRIEGGRGPGRAPAGAARRLGLGVVIGRRIGLAEDIARGERARVDQAPGRPGLVIDRAEIDPALAADQEIGGA